MTTGEERLNRVASRLGKARRSGQGYVALCPAHNDHRPSLSVNLDETNGRVLMCCGAGCPIESVLEAIGLNLADVAPDDAPRSADRPPVAVARRYEYHAADGTLIAIKLRHPGRGAKFSWQLPSGERRLNGLQIPLYRLPALTEAVRMGRDVFVTEGERDANCLAALGHAVTSPPHGARTKWRQEWSASLAGARVTIVADRDEVGVLHAQRVAAAMTEAACTVVSVLVPPAPWKDVTELIEGGLELADLLDIGDYEAPTGKEMVTKDGTPAWGKTPYTWSTDLDGTCLKIATYLDALQCFYGLPPKGRNRLAREIGLSAGRFTVHVAHLKQAGILKERTEGRKMFAYEVVNPSRPNYGRPTSGTGSYPPVNPLGSHLEGDCGTECDPLPISTLSDESFSSREGGGDGGALARVTKVFPGAQVRS